MNENFALDSGHPGFSKFKGPFYWAVESQTRAKKKKKKRASRHVNNPNLTPLKLKAARSIVNLCQRHGSIVTLKVDNIYPR